MTTSSKRLIQIAAWACILGVAVLGTYYRSAFIIVCGGIFVIAGGIGIRYQRITTLERGREGVPLSGGKALVYSVMLLCLGAIMVVLEILRALGSFG